MFTSRTFAMKEWNLLSVIQKLERMKNYSQFLGRQSSSLTRREIEMMWTNEVVLLWWEENKKPLP